MVVALVVIGGVLLLLLVIGLVTRVTVRAARAGTKPRLGEGAFLRRANANSFGVRSRGKGQVRGNGTLTLTDDELWFAQWVPQRDVRIPRSSIRAVDTTRSHLGKTAGRKLLRVRWAVDGGEDEIALWVRDLDGWLRDLGATGDVTA